MNIKVSVNELLFIEQSIKARIDYYNNSNKENATNYINDLNLILDKINIIKTKKKLQIISPTLQIMLENGRKIEKEFKS